MWCDVMFVYASARQFVYAGAYIILGPGLVGTTVGVMVFGPGLVGTIVGVMVLGPGLVGVGVGASLGAEQKLKSISAEAVPVAR